MTDREQAWVAALDTLDNQQLAMYEELERGFDTRSDVVLWMHEASVRTLGQLPDDWFSDQLSDRYRVASLLDDSRERERLTPSAPSESLAALERHLVADTDLFEAARAAMALLNEQALDYGESEEGRDPGKQRWLAMRPALDELVDKQRAVIREALGRGGEDSRGLASRRDVSQWSRKLVRATTGARGGLTGRSLWDPWDRMVLQGSTDSPSLHLLLADDVLPVMNATIRREATAAREVPAEEREHHGPLEI
ncbi:hypothetical protein ACFQH6_19375 [Halobacteriaceae archaeon GCM10025711]